MRLSKITGTGTALITPFKNGKIDYSALENIIEHNINGGVEFLVSLGTTGEAVTIFRKECQQILKFTLDVVDGRIPLVAGLFGGHWTEAILERLDTYDLEGFTAIMSSSPNYNKPPQEGIFEHFMKIAEKSSLPIIIYNVPGRTASNVAPATILKLANADKKFVAVKEASGNFNQIHQLLKNRPKDFAVLSGDDPTALATIAIGGEGVISVISNAFPRTFSDMIRAAQNGDYSTAQSLNLELYDFHKWLYKDGNPAGIKAVLNLLGFCENELNLPLIPASKETIGKLEKEVKKMAQFSAFGTSN